jgi:hypothetical protein
MCDLFSAFFFETGLYFITRPFNSIGPLSFSMFPLIYNSSFTLCIKEELWIKPNFRTLDYFTNMEFNFFAFVCNAKLCYYFSGK